MRLDKNTVFDYDTHRKEFISYLEVIILKDGSVEYAVPSHQLKLIDVYCKENNVTVDEMYDIIPLTEHVLYWLVYNTGCISVWYDFIYAPKNITHEQKETLKKLVNEKCMGYNYDLNYIYLEESSGWLRSCKGVSIL